jgi:hypothetical protein
VEVGTLIREAALDGVTLDTQSLAFTARRGLEDLARRFFDAPEDLKTLKQLRKKVTLSLSMPFEVDLWKVQNLYFQSMKGLLAQEHPTEWVDAFLELGDALALRIPGRP